jgi:hypothetical protein
MGRMMSVLGVFLLITVLGAVMYLVLSPTQTVLCQSGERLLEEQGQFFCVNAENTRIPQQSTASDTLPILVTLMMFSIGMIVVGGMLASRKPQVTSFNWTGEVKQYPFSPGEQYPIKQTTGNSNALNGKLRQLDEARAAGVISQTEYDRLRQKILDSRA